MLKNLLSCQQKYFNNMISGRVTLFLPCYCCLVAKSCPTLCDLITTACHSCPSLTISQNLPKFMSTESVMPSNPLILCCPLLLLPSIFPSIRVFSSDWAVCIRQPNYWSFSFSISPSNKYSRLISFMKRKKKLFPFLENKYTVTVI